jgi:hypothetical protein
MIFKTFNSGKGTFSSQFGVLGKSFEDIGSRFKKMSDELISTNDYTISNIVNAWKNSSIKNDLSDKFIITQEDIQDKFIDLSIYDNFNENKASSILKNLQTTNEQVEANATTWDAYLQGFKDQPEMQWQKEFIQTMDIQKATTEDVVKAQNTARESAIAYNNSLQQMTIGAKAANIAMKALAMVGNMVAMYAISKLITAYDDYKKKIHEVAEEASEQAEKSAEYVDKLADLQKELSDGTKSSDELTSAFKEQLKTMGYTSSEIDNLIEKYNGLSGAISEATREALDNAQTDAYVDVASSSKALTLDAYGGLTKDILIQSVSTGNTDLDKEISKMLSSVASKSADQGKAWISKDNSAEGLYEYYNVLKDISQLIQQTAKETDNDDLLNLGSMFNTTMYGEITEAIDKLKDSAEEYGEAINRLNSIDAQIELADYLKTNDINTQEAFDAYISGIQNSTDYSETYKKVLIDVANNAFPQFVNAVKNADAALSGLGNETPISFVDYMSGVQQLATGLDQLDKIYADVQNKEDFDWSSILNNDTFKTCFSDMQNVTEEYKASYEEFIETVSNSPNDINACQQAFNKLATAYVNNEQALKGLNEENKEATINFLEEKGISNAREVIEEYLSVINEINDAGIDLENITEEQAIAFLNEANASDISRQYLINYMLQKQMANTPLNTSADVKALENLCNSLGVTGELLEYTIKLKNAMSAVEAGAPTSIYNKQISEYKAKIAELTSGKDLNMNFKFDFTGGQTSKNAAKSAAKDASDTAKDYLDKYMDYMEKSLDANKITYHEYCTQVGQTLDDMYKSGKISAQQYFDYTEQKLNKQKDVMDKILSAVTNRLDKEIDKWQKKIDSLESENDLLNNNLSNMDSALDAIDRVYDKEIDRIQAIIDGLKDANDERDRTLALEKAKYELEKAYNSRLKKLYVEGRGYIYDVDYDAIKDAQSSYDDAELDLKTSELQKQIDTLNDFKSKWDDVKNAYKYNIDEMNATALLGHDFQQTILNNNILDIENFKNQYVGIQQQINSNEALINSYNEKIEYYNALKEQWQSITSEYENQQGELLAQQYFGADWEAGVLNGRISMLNDFKNDYISIQQAIANAAWASANEQIRAAKEAQKAASGSEGGAGTIGGNDTSKTVGGYTPAGMPSNANGKDGGNRYAAATASQRNNNTIMSNEQKKTIAASKKRANNIRKYANGGVVKINPDDLLADLAKQHGEDGFVMARNGERVLTPNQNASFEKFVDLITGMNITPQMLMPDFTRFATGNSTDNSSVIVNIGDINLQGVQNAEQLGDAIIKRLPGYITQKFNNKQR